MLHAKVICFMTAIVWCAGASQVLAQHCAPIVESYLKSVSIERPDGDILLEVEYKKTGGQRKESYRAYLVAFAQSDSERIATLTPQEAIESKLVTVIQTQRSDNQQNGSYRFRWKLKTPEFVTTMLKESRLDPQRVTDNGGWKSFQDKICLAVFVPFLDDKKYSVAEGLPVDKHECNYLREAALLFETLSPKLSVHFGIVQARTLPADEYVIELNGHRAPTKGKAAAK